MQVTEQITGKGAAKAKVTPPKNAGRQRDNAPPAFWEKGEKQVASGWKKMNEQMECNLLLFQITQKGTLKIEWTNLSEGVQKAFQEVLDTMCCKGETVSETEGECFVFGYSDEAVNLSAVCTALNGKTAFFFKEI